jgi:hypothetical protein
LAYVVVQVIVLRRASGFGRVAAALPLLLMIPVFLLTVVPGRKVEQSSRRRPM